MKLNPLLAFLAAGVVAAMPAAAFAHARLTAATPAANATVAAPATVTLAFSEPLAVKLSGATLVMTGMPGMTNHPDMKMAGTVTAIARDRRSMVLIPARPLPAGTYRVDWVATGADAHRVTGAHRFVVK